MKEQSYAVDKGKGHPAGTRSTAVYTGEAVTATVVSPVLRKRTRTGSGPHDNEVPVDAFKDDLQKKLALRSVMPQPDEDKESVVEATLVTANPEGINQYSKGGGGGGGSVQQRRQAVKDQHQPPVPADWQDRLMSVPGGRFLRNVPKSRPRSRRTGFPSSAYRDPSGVGQSEREATEQGIGGQYEKEDVNYRYSSSDAESCGNCVHFIQPGYCEIVAGLIRETDVCDMFEPANDVGGGAMSYDFSPGMGDDDYEREQERTPRRGFDPDQPRGEDPDEPYMMDDGDGFSVQAEVAPPGWEPTVLKMKKHPEIDNPWALAWSMKNKGYTPGGKTVQAEVAPPGMEPVVRALKKKPSVDNPFAVAWSMYNKGQAETVEATLAGRGDLP